MGALAAFAALLLVPVVGAAASPTTLHADLAEWSVVPSSGVVPAGRVKLVVRNIGRQPHELIVVRTKQFAESLRLQGDRAAATPVAPRLLVPPGTSRTIVLTLARGSYELVDNLPWHYWQGTSAAFSVR
jgi:uncharacterized cupredoxin-like copper-binding protein